MPETITFRGVILKDMDMRQTAKGAATFLRIHLTSDFTDVIREALGWDDLPDSYRAGEPTDSSLTGVKLTVRPNGVELKKYAFTMPIRLIRDFAVVTVKDGEDEVRQLNFTVETSAKGAYKTIGAFIDAIGHGRCQAKVEYAAEDENPDGTKQEELLTTEEMRSAVKPEAD
jgi:hypothetical protein